MSIKDNLLNYNTFVLSSEKILYQQSSVVVWVVVYIEVYLYNI